MKENVKTFFNIIYCWNVNASKNCQQYICVVLHILVCMYVCTVSICAKRQFSQYEFTMLKNCLFIELKETQLQKEIFSFYAYPHTHTHLALLPTNGCSSSLFVTTLIERAIRRGLAVPSLQPRFSILLLFFFCFCFIYLSCTYIYLSIRYKVFFYSGSNSWKFIQLAFYIILICTIHFVVLLIIGKVVCPHGCKNKKILNH